MTDPTGHQPPRPDDDLPEPRDIALEQATPGQVEELEARSAPDEG